MAKAFKIIMNIILVLFIAAVCAVFVPSLFGITTAVALPGSESNMQTGSIAYGVRNTLSDLQAGDQIIVNTENTTYLYEITEIDSENKTLEIRTSADAETETISLRRSASKLVIVIPLIGYLYVATQSMEGLIILALAAALIIILFIIASIVSKRHDPEEDEDAENSSEDNDDFGYFRDLAASTSAPNRLDNLGTLSMNPVSEETPAKTQDISAETMALDEEFDTLSTDELAAEIAAAEAEHKAGAAQEGAEASDADEDTVNAEEKSEASETENADSNSENVLKAEIKAAEETVSDNSEAPKTFTAESTSDLSGMENALESVLSTDKINQIEEAKTVKPAVEPEGVKEEEPEEIELAVPVFTLDELLQEAYSKGEDPQVKKDEATGVTLVDYSSCF